MHDLENPDFDRYSLLEDLLQVYTEILGRLSLLGAEWIQIDEPIFSMDLNAKQLTSLKTSYDRLKLAKGSARLLVTTYFGVIRDNLSSYLNLPVDGLHFDFVRGKDDFDDVLKNFPKDKILSAGIIDGRNIWKNDFAASTKLLKKLTDVLDPDHLWVGPSCSLIHSPVSLKNEEKLDGTLKNWLAFSDEKLTEIVTLSSFLNGNCEQKILDENKEAIESRRSSKLIHNALVKSRIANVKGSDLHRKSKFSDRQVKQRSKLQLPDFPTTTIGSFPQTKEVRQARSQWKKGHLSDADYDLFLKEETRKCVSFQNEVDIDMLVHGEFERNDMVEYFGECLEGFTFTSHGWVQSYGSRYVKPPIIFGDVSRPKPMTVYWTKYAQSLTDRPMKGMLTGPVTILQWSFVRDDQPLSDTALQIALSIRDEAIDLEKAGIAAIQIDEPAFREGLPLRHSEWPSYLDWAVKAFRLSSCGVQDDTQIHTHMCYSEFNDIIKSIADLDADVITIETSRSNMELLDAFVAFDYPNEIGPGVYDIHSPRVPPLEEMENLMGKAQAVLPSSNLWVNPDCGLKTRSWDEVIPSLSHMVSAAKKLRTQLSK